MRKPVVLVVVWSIQIGGAETFAADLCDYLNKKGVAACLFPVFSTWDRAYYATLRSRGIRVASLFRGRWLDYFFWKANAVAARMGLPNLKDRLTAHYFRYLIRAKKVKVVISNSLDADLFCHRYRAHNAVPHWVVEHGEYSYAAVDKTPIDTSALVQAHRVVSVSRWCQATIAEKWGVPSRVIYNGWQATHEPLAAKREEGTAFRLGMIGRGVAYKGWREAAEAFVQARKSVPALELHFVGDGPELAALRQEFAHEHSMIFHGRITAPQAVLQHVDVGLVLSRHYEAFGIALLDFFRLGKPVIATRVGAIPEVVDLPGGPGGLLIDVDERGHARISEVANAIVRLAQNPSERGKLSQRAKTIAQAFHFEKTGQAYWYQIIEPHTHD